MNRFALNHRQAFVKKTFKIQKSFQLFALYFIGISLILILKILKLILFCSTYEIFLKSDVWLTVHRNSVWIGKTN